MIYFVIALVVVAVIIYLYVQINFIDVRRFDIRSDRFPDSFKGKKILQISDLHGKKFGEDNCRIKDIIYRENPDAVFVTGDMVDGDRLNFDAVYDLLRDVSSKYRTFYIIGNHEQKSCMKKYRHEYSRYYKALADTDIINICNEKVDVDSDFNIIRRIRPSSNTVKVDNQSDAPVISIYGLAVPFESYRYMFSNRDVVVIDSNFVEKRLGPADRDNICVLLAHNPLYFDEYAKWGADFVFCGHVHGGIIRLPVLGPLLSPDRTFFPKYSSGEYSKDGSHMFVSRGLGSSAVYVRVGCRPDICVYTIK